MEEEIWKNIKGYTNYMVSNMGRMKSLKRMVVRNNNRPLLVEEKILKPSVNKKGYLFICLRNNGKLKYFRLHRLVAEAFISNPNNYPCVNHKDENKQNNCVENLEWCTVKYNNIYNGRQKRIAAKRKKITLQINPNTNEIIAEFPSTIEAQRQLGISHSHISACCNNKPHCNTAGGFKWKYKKGDY